MRLARLLIGTLHALAQSNPLTTGFSAMESFGMVMGRGLQGWPSGNLLAAWRSDKAPGENMDSHHISSSVYQTGPKKKLQKST
jgi:hypothetical protein